MTFEIPIEFQEKVLNGKINQENIYYIHANLHQNSENLAVVKKMTTRKIFWGFKSTLSYNFYKLCKLRFKGNLWKIITKIYKFQSLCKEYNILDKIKIFKWNLWQKQNYISIRYHLKKKKKQLKRNLGVSCNTLLCHMNNWSRYQNQYNHYFI